MGDPKRPPGKAVTGNLRLDESRVPQAQGDAGLASWGEEWKIVGGDAKAKTARALME